MNINTFIIGSDTVTIDGDVLYTQEYLLTMMQREYRRGYSDGLEKGTTIHKVEFNLPPMSMEDIDI